MEGPIIVQSTLFRCPRCRRTYTSMEAFEGHRALCSDEADDRARALVGTWAMVVGSQQAMYGKVVGTDGPRVVIRGIRIEDYGSVLRMVDDVEFKALPEEVRDGSSVENLCLAAQAFASASIREHFDNCFRGYSDDGQEVGE